MHKIPLLINCQTPRGFVSELIGHGFNPLPVPPCTALAAPVAAHPDLLFFRGGNSLICNRNYYNENQVYLKAILKNYIDPINPVNPDKLRLRLSNESLNREYPGDVSLSAVWAGRFLFCLASNISAAVLEYADAAGLEIVNIRQGYAKCAVCVVSDNAIITADKAIAAAARTRGIDTLEIKPGYISLPGYDCGFIGGASFTACGTVLFFGDLRSHPDGAKIADFCRSHGGDAISLGGGILRDYGSPVVIGM